MTETTKSIDDMSPAELYRAWVATPEGKAREKLDYAIKDLQNDPDIKASQICVDFLELVYRLNPAGQIDTDSLADIVAALEPYFRKVQSKKNAKLRHEPHNRARDFVCRQWESERAAYGGNKSAFARDYVRRIRNEMGVAITEKQMREVWLKDTPSAS